MKYLLLTLLCVFLTVKAQALENINSFHIEYEPLKGDILNKVKEYSWKKKCPVKLSELILLKVSYWGFDDKAHIGSIIVHRKASPEVILIFKELFENKFPIASLKLMYEYFGDDDQSMLANNTVAFNCRLTTNHKSKFSRHSYGIAIDINPFINPYYKKGKVIPATAGEYLDRDIRKKGLITKKSICYKLFKQKGWRWGGNWKSLKDYQHFEKKLSVFKKEKKYSLIFKNLPANAVVKIMNIRKSYSTNKFLSRGLYDVQITSKNKRKQLWIKVDSDLSVDYLKL